MTKYTWLKSAEGNRKHAFVDGDERSICGVAIRGDEQQAPLCKQCQAVARKRSERYCCGYKMLTYNLFVRKGIAGGICYYCDVCGKRTEFKDGTLVLQSTPENLELEI